MRSEGIKSIRGPFDFDINGESGILVDVFNSPPHVMVFCTKEYFPELFEKIWIQKGKDLYCWKYEVPSKILEFTQDIYETMKYNPGIQIRSFSKKEFERDVLVCSEIFNNAWSKNWRFLPITESEVKILAENLKLILVNDLVFIVEYEGKPCVICIAIPNLNKEQRKKSIKKENFPGFYNII